MKQILECVPNFSEGRDEGRIAAIAEAMDQVSGAYVLHVDAGAGANRTVITAAGEPAAVVESAYAGIRTAAQQIDMRGHSGAHPRMGATDVCPLVPVKGLSLEEAAELARQLGRRVGEELGIPVFFYEAAATAPHRRSLAKIRSGEYEGMAAKLQKPRWQPDVGPAELPPRAGASVIGARPFLAAYNINLDTPDAAIAAAIARRLRESGRVRRDEQGEIRRDQGGKALREPGLLKACRAIGWYIEEFGFAQVSTNLIDLSVTGLAEAYTTTAELARAEGVRVTGSELVGLLPLFALRDAGLALGGRSGEPLEALLQTAIDGLGLEAMGPFRPEERILEYRLAQLSGLSLQELMP